ncbi:4548_t:CDS:2 [Diversispora eburnea]|uniref:4548_t:CDS:1 n=1 Tax=Diversispora eburnea TaxID=1213867 RepID=A0A9N8YZN9_9GLOM|nr:4548_t:CDS:2 [Diversispora eburnea]
MFDCMKSDAVISEIYKSKSKQQKAVRRTDACYHQCEREQQRTVRKLATTDQQICSNNVLAEFREKDIHLSLLELNKYFEKSFFEIDFLYGHPRIN